MGLVRVYEGEKAILINRNGEIKQIKGPNISFLILSKLEKLKLITASNNQYLIIKHINGNIEHKPGPISIWKNRFLHESIEVKNSYTLDDSQIIVVYERDELKNKVNRRLVKGPCVFYPNSNEWLHQFKWHVEDPSQTGHMIQDGAKFEILTQKADFFHYHIKEVRTLDDSLITIKIMLIYELKNIELMLDKTQDPISDFINAICADVVGLVSKLSFSEFLKESSIKLNNIDSYEQLIQRVNRNGFEIKSIIYTGYSSSDSLQEMQDSAIQTRTQLRLNNEVEKQKNDLINLRLENEHKRFDLESKLNKLKFNFNQICDQAKLEFELENKKLENEFKLKLNDLEQQLDFDLIRKKNEIEQDYLKKLYELNVDVNQLKLNENKSMNKIDRVYELI